MHAFPVTLIPSVLYFWQGSCLPCGFSDFGCSTMSRFFTLTDLEHHRFVWLPPLILQSGYVVPFPSAMKLNLLKSTLSVQLEGLPLLQHRNNWMCFVRKNENRSRDQKTVSGREMNAFPYTLEIQFTCEVDKTFFTTDVYTFAGFPNS